jgi:hypothetical protein
VQLASCLQELYTILDNLFSLSALSSVGRAFD